MSHPVPGSEGSERIIQVLGCDHCTLTGNVKQKWFSVVVAPLWADVSGVSIVSVSNVYQEIDVRTATGVDSGEFR